MSNVNNYCILIIKANEMQCFSHLFLIKNSTCFGQIYCPSSGVSTLYTQQLVFVMLVHVDGVLARSGWSGRVRKINTKHKYNRHATTNLKSLSLVTDVKKIYISLWMVKN